MVFKATFNNISAISWQSDLLMEETQAPEENHWPVTGSCKSNYHMITTTTAPKIKSEELTLFNIYIA